VSEEIQFHKWLKDDTVKIKLMKMSKGYQWEITYEGEDVDIVIARIVDVDTKLKAQYEKEV